MIAIIDYGAGNLFSVNNALKYLGLPCKITADKKEIEQADQLILPGVGAFPDAMRMIRNTGLLETIRIEAVKKPFLGICLGMQLLFGCGFEFEKTEGLQLIPGTVEIIQSSELKIPHMGWSDLVLQNGRELTRGLQTGDRVYFVHSYAVKTDDRYIAAYCEYGGKVPAIVASDTVYGTQFHPEKSGEVGLQILKNFGEIGL